MEKEMFYCKKCNSMWSGTPYSQQTCPDCGNSMIKTNISLEEWKSKTPEEKDTIKTVLKEGQSNPAYEMIQNNDLLSYVKKISDDLTYIRNTIHLFVILFFISVIISIITSIF